MRFGAFQVNRSETRKDRIVRLAVTGAMLVLLGIVADALYRAAVAFNPLDLFLYSIPAVALVAFLVVLGASGSLPLAFQVTMGIALVYFYLEQAINGNLNQSLIFSAVLPIFGIVVLGPRRSLKWFGLFLLLMIAVAFSDRFLPHIPLAPVNDYLPRRAFGPYDYLFHMWWKVPFDMRGLVYFVLIMSLCYAILYALFRQLERAQATIEELILNVLPRPVVDRLRDREPDRMRGGAVVIADDFGEVSILFADIVGFTPLSAALTPHQTVELLNTIFVAFDDLADARGVEKLKTIGDAYMAVAGPPTRRRTMRSGSPTSRST